MADAGLFHDRRVELIEGEVVDMPPQKNAHYTAILLVQRALEKAFGTNHTVRVQGPLDLGERSQPEPDVAVVTGSPRDYRDHPKTAVLVVEVSDTTLEFDRVRKQRIYAKAGIQEFWIVNLIARVLELHRSPVPDAQHAHYDDIEPVAEGGAVTPLAAPTSAIRIADLLP